MEFNQYIKKRRLALGLSMQDVANATGVSEGTVSRWESGEIADIKRSKLSLLAQVLKVKPSSLIDDDFKPEEYLTIKTDNFDFIDVPTTRIPIVGHVACGEPLLADENIIGYMDPIDYVKADFCLIAKGDSMIDADIHENDIVFVQQTEQVDNGEIAVVLIGEEATLKKYRNINGKVMLIPANDNYEPIFIEEESTVKILGRATHIMKVIK